MLRGQTRTGLSQAILTLLDSAFCWVLGREVGQNPCQQFTSGPAKEEQGMEFLTNAQV